jgi:hypothetical protein
MNTLRAIGLGLAIVAALVLGFVAVAGVTGLRVPGS